MATLRPRIARRSGVLAAGMALTLSLAACAESSSNNPPSGGGGNGGGATTVTIGFMGDLTGPDSGIVIPPKNGAKLAIDEYNAKNPKVKITLKEYDTQGKPDQAAVLVPQAIGQDKIVGLIGPAFSGESKAVGAQLDQGKIPSISPSATNVDLAKNSWQYWHRVVANDGDQGPNIANFLVKAKSPKKAFVISDDSEYGVGLAQAVQTTFSGAGVTVETDKFAKGASDLSSTVSKVSAAAPDVIFYGGYYSELGRLIKQLRDGKVTALIASGDGSLDAQLVSAAGGTNSEGTVLGCPCFIAGKDATGDLKSFFDRYKTSAGADPAIYSTEGFDAATAFIKAIEAGNTTGEAINNWLKTADFQGLSKKIKFKANGEPEANSIFVYQVQGGAIKLLGPSQEAKLAA